MNDPRALLEASGFGRVVRRARQRLAVLRDCCKLFALEARDNPRDRAYLLACARDLFRRYRRAGGT